MRKVKIDVHGRVVLKWVRVYGVDLSASGQGPVKGSSEHCN
jgi:hypothetical protein